MNESKELPKKREREQTFLSKYLDRPVNYLISHNFTPNILSYIGFFLSIVAAFFIAIGSIHFIILFAWPAPVLLFISGAFDVFDGEVARRTGTESKAGAFLDSNLDRFSDMAIVLGLIYGKLVDYLLGFVLLFFIIMISYTRSRAENEGIDMKGIGLMERADRIISLIIGLIIETWIYFLTSIFLGEPFTGFFTGFIIVYLVLVIFTVLYREYYALKMLGKIKSSEKSLNPKQ